MTVMCPGRYGLLPLDKVERSENHHIEHAATQYISCGYIGKALGHRAYTGDEFRKRGDRCYEEHPDPCPPHAGPATNPEDVKA